VLPRESVDRGAQLTVGEADPDVIAGLDLADRPED
jgi:hypothetical protein